MASGKEHEAFNKQVLLFVVPLSVLIFIIFSLYFNVLLILPASFFYLGLLFGYLFGPDMDADGTTIDEVRLGKILSWSVKWIWHGAFHIAKLLNRKKWVKRLRKRNRQRDKATEKFFQNLAKIFWYPYALAMPHRSGFSHVPVLSDIIRILYVLFLGTFVVMLIPLSTGMIDVSIWELLRNLAGMVFSFEYWQLKVTLVTGSSIMTLSHLYKDDFGVHW